MRYVTITHVGVVGDVGVTPSILASGQKQVKLTLCIDEYRHLLIPIDEKILEGRLLTPCMSLMMTPAACELQYPSTMTQCLFVSRQL